MSNSELLELLVCPLCRQPVEPSEQSLACVNRECGCRYRIHDGIPVMLIDEADRPCPACRSQREWNDETLQCRSCGKSYP